MTKQNRIKYSNHIAEHSHYVFIDGVCVKSRSDDLETTQPSIEEALLTDKDVVIQEGSILKVYTNNEGLEYYRQWLKNMTEKKANQSLIKKSEGNFITVFTSDYEDGYPFFKSKEV